YLPETKAPYVQLAILGKGGSTPIKVTERCEDHRADQDELTGSEQHPGCAEVQPLFEPRLAVGEECQAKAARSHVGVEVASHDFFLRGRGKSLLHVWTTEGRTGDYPARRRLRIPRAGLMYPEGRLTGAPHPPALGRRVKRNPPGAIHDLRAPPPRFAG